MGATTFVRLVSWPDKRPISVNPDRVVYAVEATNTTEPTTLLELSQGTLQVEGCLDYVKDILSGV